MKRLRAMESRFASSGAGTPDRLISRPAINPLSYRGSAVERNNHKRKYNLRQRYWFRGDNE